MRGADRVQTMGDGDKLSWVRDATTDPNRGTNWQTSGLSYSPGTAQSDTPELDPTSGYYEFPGVSETCFAGMECMGTTSRRFSATFYKKWGFDKPEDMLALFQSTNEGPSGKYGAWNLKDVFKGRELGDVIWDKTSGTELTLDQMWNLKGGDMVTFTGGPNTYNYDQPKWEEEKDVTHVGMIVGRSNGIPVVEHSYQRQGKHVTKRELLTNVSTYKPSSVLRYNKHRDGSKEAPAPITPRGIAHSGPSSVSTGYDSNDAKEYKELTHISGPRSFNNLQHLHNYLTDLGDDIRSRMQGYSVRNEEGESYTIFDTSAVESFSSNNYVTERSYMWKPTDVEDEEEDEKKGNKWRIFNKNKKDRGAEQTEIKTKKVPSARRGGLIYRR